MYDFAIIGSGVSGARIAYELTAGGAKCVMIEAGRKFDRHSYPRGELGYSTQMFWGGGIEITHDGRIGLLRGKCLGGTSVINQADLNRFDDSAWDDWRQRSGIRYFQAADIDPLYDHLDEVVISGPIPRQHYNRNAELFIKALDQAGFSWRGITRSQTDCRLDQGTDCIVCLGGCPRDAKQSALITVIPAAVEQGLRIETEFEIHSLEHANDAVRIRGIQNGGQRELIAAKAVLAAGVLGNVKILNQSPRIAASLPALGTGFCCHPQYMMYACFRDPVDAHKGALQSVESHDERIRAAGVKFENVYAPPIATAMLMPGIRGRHLASMKKYRYMASMEVAVRDEPAGRIKLSKKGRLIVDKPLTDQDRRRMRYGWTLLAELLWSTGPQELIQCGHPYGLHLMGGCPIGTDPKRSVVGPDFRIHGQRNLYAADSSIFPSAPGINPSFTIMALSYKAAHEMLAER